jgi:hypothetical protein
MFSANDFIPTQYSHSIGGNFQWSAPSNIALVKYWKKNQIPAILRLVYPKELQNDNQVGFFAKGKNKIFFLLICF